MGLKAKEKIKSSLSASRFCKYVVRASCSRTLQAIKYPISDQGEPKQAPFLTLLGELSA